MNGLWQDVRYSLRFFARSPRFFLITVLTLAAGIGANSTIFTWIEGVLLHPMPGAARQDRLVAIAGIRQPGSRCCTFSYADYVLLRDHNTVFDGVQAAELAAINLSVDGHPQRVVGMVVSANYFDVLGVRAALGRTFLPEEEGAALANPVAVISYGLWKRQFGGDPAILSRPQTMNGRSFTIVGVAPEGFKGTFVGYALDVWVPLTMQPVFMAGGDRMKNPADRWLEGFARLKPGVTIEQAQAQLTSVSKELQTRYPDSDRDSTFRAYPLSKTPFGVVDLLSPVLGMAMGVVGLVLLIACANLAGLQLTRAVLRRREIAIRMAIGAGRGQVLRQMIVESLLLSLCGGAAGLLMAYWLRESLVRFFPATSASLSFGGPVDGRVLLFTAVITLLAGILSGSMPALRGSRMDVAASLKEGGAGGGELRQARARGLLVAGQIALCTVLLAGGSLFLQSLRNARKADIGLEPAHLLDASLDLFASGYSDAQGKVFWRRLLERANAIPGVRSATLASRLPLSVRGPATVEIAVEGFRPRAGESTYAEYSLAGPNYFGTLGIKLLRGRDFGTADAEGAPAVAIVNETMARRYWPDTDALGKRLRIVGKWHEIVGIARDVKYHNLNEEPRAYAYLPLEQNYAAQATLVLQTANPTALVSAVQGAARDLDPQLLIYDVQPLATYLGWSLFSFRLGTTVIGIFAAIALLLAAVGLYAVISHAVVQRAHEFAVRTALGASNSDLTALLVRQSLRLIVSGLVVGLLAAIFLTRLIEGQIYGVKASDPLTYAAISLLLAAIALLAALAPARRIAKLDTLAVLRYM